MKSQVWIGKKRLKKPLIQGGMGIGVSLSGLAGAVAKEGGAGTISAAQIGFLQPEFEQNPVLANLKAMEEELQRRERLHRMESSGLIFMDGNEFIMRPM